MKLILCNILRCKCKVSCNLRRCKCKVSSVLFFMKCSNPSRTRKMHLTVKLNTHLYKGSEQGMLAKNPKEKILGVPVISEVNAQKTLDIFHKAFWTTWVFSHLSILSVIGFCLFIWLHCWKIDSWMNAERMKGGRHAKTPKSTYVTGGRCSYYLDMNITGRFAIGTAKERAAVRSAELH